MARSASTSGKDVSVRVQIFPHSNVMDKAVTPLKAFRLRLKHDSSFTELASIALARFAKEDPEKGGKAAISTILDETDCAVDMDDLIDIIKEGEILKLVLEAGRSAALSYSSPVDPVTSVATDPLPRPTPAVKNIRPRTPAALKHLVSGSSQAARSSQKVHSQPKASQRLENQGTKKSKPIVTKRVQDGGTGSKRDPYEVPSDTDNIMSRTARGRAPYSQPSATVCSASTETNKIHSDDKNMLTGGSSLNPSSTSYIPNECQSSGDPISAATPKEKANNMSKPSMPDGLTSYGKRSGSHTINSHLNIIEEKDKAYQSQTQDATPAYVVKSSHGVRPVFLRKETPCSTITAREVPGTSASSAKSSKSSKSVGSLTLTPSRVAQAAKNLEAIFQLESQNREAEKRRLAQEQAELEDSRIRAKAKVKSNLPSAAIAHMKKITSAKSIRKESRYRVPNSFFEEPEYSDEDLGDIITGTQISSTETGLHCSRGSPQMVASRRSASTSRGVTPTTAFKPVNRLRYSPKPIPKFQLPKKFGAGYSQQVRDAFSDLDTSDSDSGATRHSTKKKVAEHPDVTSEDAFQQWSVDYETNYIPHLGFCSVADGPFKGLIRGGPNHGKYLAGHKPPTQGKISEMEKTATRNVRATDRSLSESIKDSDSDSEDHLTPNRQSTRTTSATQAEATPTCISKQLSQEAPPSNQELGILMSSSPSRDVGRHTRTHPCRRSARLASAQDVVIAPSQKQEPNKTLVAHESGHVPPVIEHTPKRNTRSHPHDTDLEVTPNFERALSQVETPSTRSRSQQKSRTKNQKGAKEELPPVGIGKIVVKIPEMLPEQQAKYRKIPELCEQGLLAAPIRSFEDINRIHEDANGDSQDSAAAAIAHVLEASPSWLANVTEVEGQPSTAPKKAPYVLRSQTDGGPPKTTVQATMKHNVGENKDLDPTYEPSEYGNEPNGSADLRNRKPRNTARKHSNATPRRPSQTEETNHVPLGASIEVTGLIPGKNTEVLARVPSLISSTPIPVPSIPDLMNKLKNESRIQTSQVVEDSVKPARNAPEHAQSYGQSEEVIFESPPRTTIPALMVPTPKSAPGTGSESNKRKHKQFYDTDTNDTILQPKQKKQKERPNNSATDKTTTSDRPETYPRERTHHKGGKSFDDEVSEVDNEEVPIVKPLTVPTGGFKIEPQSKHEENTSSVLDASFAITIPAHHVSTAIADTSKARKKKQKKNKRREKRRIFLQADNEALRSAIPVPRQLTSRQMTEKENAIFRHKTQDTKPSAHDGSPTLPPMVAKPPIKQGFPAPGIIHQSLASADDKKKKKRRKTHSKPARKEFMSPPTTSRPSSAGSSI